MSMYWTIEDVVGVVTHKVSHSTSERAQLIERLKCPHLILLTPAAHDLAADSSRTERVHSRDVCMPWDDTAILERLDYRLQSRPN